MFLFKRKKKEIEKELNDERLEIEQKEELYKKKSFKEESVGPIVIAFSFFVLIIFLIFLLSIINLCINAYNANRWFGYVTICVSIAILFLLFVYPIVKIVKHLNFILEYNYDNYKNVKKHNDKVIRNIAKNIIDFNDNVKNNDYYNFLYVEELKNSLSKKDMMAVRNDVRKIMNTSVIKKSNDIIVKWAKRVGVMSAISQSETIDGIVIIICNIKLIYDLFFLYGFRYNFAKLAKSSFTILISVATASGLQSIKIGKGVMEVFGSFLRSFTKEIPFLPMVAKPVAYLTSSALSVVVDSGLQGFGNAAMTAFIGYQTIGYLNKEYRLQEELNDEFGELELLDDEREFKETLKQVKSEVEKEVKERGGKRN